MQQELIVVGMDSRYVPCILDVLLVVTQYESVQEVDEIDVLGAWHALHDWVEHREELAVVKNRDETY